MRMLYAHIFMYKTKMEEVNSAKYEIDEPFNYPSINQKQDKDWIYF